MALTRTAFPLGWVPDADPVNGPPEGLLNMTNGILDEQGVVSARLGSSKINSSPFADTDIHSLFTAVLSGTRYRMAGAGSAVYANGTSIASGIAGSGDIAFGSHLGQILFARSTTKKKYDGSTVRNWGISMTGGAPTITAVTADFKVFASCDSGETTWTTDEGTATGAGLPGNAAGYDGTASAACEVSPSATSGGRIRMTKAFGADTNFTSYGGGQTGSEQDQLTFWVYLTEPATLVSVRLLIDVTSGSGQPYEDYYYFKWSPNVTVETPPPDDPNNQAPPDTSGENSAFVSEIQPVAGWQKLSVRRWQMGRVQTAGGQGRDWATVRRVRVLIETTGSGTGSAVRIDDIRITSASVAGKYNWIYIYVRNDGTYTAKSASSAASSETAVLSHGVDVVAPADASRDSQINEIWVFRKGGDLDVYYRTKVQTGVSGTGAVTIRDALSDTDALIVDIKLETDNVVPPDNIIDIEGPYYDRTFALTATFLYPSRRLNPDSFATGQSIRVSGADETAYWVRKALGGLYIGTSKDIYVLDGDGAEYEDGSINFSFKALNIDNPPINEAVAQEGNNLVYLAADGWRAVQGGGSQSLTGVTSLLYRGYSRGGASAINLTTGRFRAAITKGQLTATTPEGTSTTTTSSLFRYHFTKDRWYRHQYGAQGWRCVQREPDGTLIASDNAGYVWVLDTGTLDGTSAVAVTIWTKHDDDGNPFVRKDPIDLRVHADTGNVAATVALYRNSSSSADATAVTVTQNGIGITAASLENVRAFRQMQLRITINSTAGFRFAGFSLNYAALPQAFVGLLPQTNFGSPQQKTLSGLQLRLCTLGAAVTITPYVDGTAQTSFSVTTDTDEPDDYTHAFASAVEGVDLALVTTGDVELYDWQPIITAKRPLGIKAWDSGPMDLGVQDLVWVREVLIKVRAAADLTVTPYFDDEAFEAVTISVGSSANTTTILSVPVGRSYKGRTPRMVITSTSAFYPYWVEFIRRQTQSHTQKGRLRVPVNLGGEVAA
jgi:hypothetical protein